MIFSTVLDRGVRWGLLYCLYNGVYKRAFIKGRLYRNTNTPDRSRTVPSIWCEPRDLAARLVLAADPDLRQRAAGGLAPLPVGPGAFQRRRPALAPRIVAPALHLEKHGERVRKTLFDTIPCVIQPRAPSYYRHLHT